MHGRKRLPANPHADNADVSPSGRFTRRQVIVSATVLPAAALLPGALASFGEGLVVHERLGAPCRRSGRKHPLMIENAETWQPGRFRDKVYDVCIIGSGPAGITLARRLAAAGLSVGLFEGGDFDFEERSQQIYEGENVGQPYYPLDACRLRYFGGTSNHWGGWTRPLDAYDFEPRPHNPLSGWPIAKTDLDPYEAEASDILNLPGWRDPPDFLPGETGLVPRLFRFSRPTTRFGEKYRAELEASKLIEVFTNANLVDMKLDEGGGHVSEAVFRSYEKNGDFAVRARQFALCLGGLENPRAMLNINGQVPAGLGNEHDLVGRYFLEHAHAPLGKAVLRTPPDWMLVYSPTPQYMDANKVLNFGIRIGYFDQWNAPEFTGAFAPAQPCGVSFEDALQAALRGDDPPCPDLVVDVMASCEQELRPDNRVKLIEETDKFGWRRIALEWHLSDMDVRTLREAAIKIAAAMAAQDVGRMRIVDWLMNGDTPTLDQVWGGNHHMGTTRMSADPATGVVDADCRVHALDNLYIGGSSVFPTSGHANPTYTIVQLALRLGDHLRGRLKP